MTKKQAFFWLNHFYSQRDWFDSHGGNIFAYVERYGSKDDANHYGEGGEAIYAADKAALDHALVKAHHAQRLLR